MRFSALRTRFLALTVFFSLVLVGAVSIVSFVVVTESMVDVAESTMLDLAVTADALIGDEVSRALDEAENEGLAGDERDEKALLALVDTLPDLLQAGVVAQGEYAIYSGEGILLWSTSPAALNGHADHRDLAVQHERSIDSGRIALRGFSGIFGPADMGEYIAHVPIGLPGIDEAVLDVTYLPVREESTIDRIRPWMMALTLVSTIIAIVLMQVSTGWVLGLIGDLRGAAEAVDDNQLDVRLPDLGNHEIGDLARSINSLLERLSRRAEAQTRFVADASHELATPVAGIRGYVNILREWGGEDEALREEAIEAIDRESSRMARLCSDLLSLIRRERFSDAQVRRFDVNSLAREALAGAATRYIDKGIEFIGPEEGQLPIYGDPDRLMQLLGVLVDNAAKYTDRGGVVEVRTWRRLDIIHVQVIDTGLGIPASDLPHIFERFYRSDKSRSPQTGGFGIGLSIAGSVVEMMGGEISVESTEGVGTAFTIKLPRKPAEPTE